MRDILCSKRKRKGETGGKFSRNIPRNFKSLPFERCDFRVNYSTQTPKKQHFSADQSEKSYTNSLPTSKSGGFQKVNLLKEFFFDHIKHLQRNPFRNGQISPFAVFGFGSAPFYRSDAIKTL